MVLQPETVTEALNSKAIIGRCLIQPNGIDHIPHEKKIRKPHKYLDNRDL